ncbi:ImuA family protein [Aquabacter cavernae]|uniref:ImuA family protein n=1 Tax=Aquabacter cavernae TaxID=2496029 RepID=UPI001FE10BB7|nr:hypothetical protein [Aquabacter cavernae]
MAVEQDVSALRRVLAGLEAEHLPGASSTFTLGAAGADGQLADGLPRGVLHEVHAAAGADIPAASGFALALALRASVRHANMAQPILWVRQDMLDSETGALHAPGVAGLGLDPAQIILVRVRDAEQALRAAGDAARCPALGAVLLEPWGEPKALDLTATRRLALRARESGVTMLLLRMTDRPMASVALTRWQVRPLVSAPLAAGAPGAPAFAATLLRHRGGLQGRTWKLEWDHESRSFRDFAPLSRAVVPVPSGRTVAQGGGHTDVRPFRRAG